jgi:polyhydroxyalkanoate synthase
MSQTDESVFEVGRNVATTEGAVVFENELFQLIEYKPLTAKVYERPFLLVPPCINKFYILDLQPDNSLIRYAVQQGHRVFVLSWRNADDAVAKLTWDQYIEDAAIRAIGLVQEISGSAKINALGFCVGGTILATALAVLAARGEKPVASMTLLTTLLDFSNTGVLDLFIDEAMVKMRELTLGPGSPSGGSLLKGQELATTFSFLRPNDLVWNYVVGNYLKGETRRRSTCCTGTPTARTCRADVLLVPAQHLPREQPRRPGKTTVAGQKVDLGAIDVPTYLYASREDHIVPWEGAYRSTGALKGKLRFVLGASGHIAGVINPAGERQAQPLDRCRRCVADGPAAVVRRRQGAPGQLVDRLGDLAEGPRRQAGAAPEDARHRPLQADRAGAGPLRQGEGLRGRGQRRTAVSSVCWCRVLDTTPPVSVSST